MHDAALFGSLVLFRTTIFMVSANRSCRTFSLIWDMMDFKGTEQRWVWRHIKLRQKWKWWQEKNKNKHNKWSFKEEIETQLNQFRGEKSLLSPGEKKTFSFPERMHIARTLSCLSIRLKLVFFCPVSPRVTTRFDLGQHRPEVFHLSRVSPRCGQYHCQVGQLKCPK